MKNVVLLLLVITGITSCKPSTDLKPQIPREIFVEILTDIHLADGYYMMRANIPSSHIQNNSLYTNIIKEHGYTRANFDSTLKYYTLNPKKFENIYDDVITQLNKLQQQVFLLQQYSDTTRNFYKKKSTWHLPKDGQREMIPFKVAVKDTGLYTIIVQLRIFDDDQSKDPHLTAYFWFDDGSKNGHIEYFPFIVYQKTKRMVVLSTKKRFRNKKITHIKGWVLNHDNKELNFTKHAEVKSIIVARN
jgi:hypothetical protein